MKTFKRWLVIMLAVCMVFTQSMGVTAQAKTTKKQTSKNKYTIALNKSVYTMKKGKKVTLKTTLNKAAKKKGVTWKSSNKKVATVNSKGQVVAKKNGKTTITATVKGTKIKAVCKIVVGTPVTKVTLNQKDATLDIGKTVQLKVTVKPKKPTNKKVKYTSSNANIAKVDSKGLVTAVAEGTAMITAEAADGSGKKATCKITVNPAPAVPTVQTVAATGVVLNAEHLSLKPGEKNKLTASVVPNNTTNKTITWSSSNAQIATVAADGTVTAVTEGNANIIATASNGVKATCAVTVAYDSLTGTQAALNNALASKMTTEVVFTSNAAETIVIPKGNYSTKTLTINAPNATVENNGTFKKVVINAIAKNTYIENSTNIIDFNAPVGHIIIKQNGNATINMSSAPNQELHLENIGNVVDLNVKATSKLKIEGSKKVPVSLGTGAANTAIITSTELAITALAKWAMTILPGGEQTKANVMDEAFVPTDVTGVGSVQVTVGGTDMINVPAVPDEDLEIDQKVKVAGVVTSVSTNSVAENMVVVGDSVDVYMVPYDGTDMYDADLTTYLKDTHKKATTDADGNYEIENVTIGNYWLLYAKEQFDTVVKNLIITSANSDIYTATEAKILSSDITGTTNISGTVIDGLTGESTYAEGLTVKLRKQSGNITGEVYKTAYTDEDGNYSFPGVPKGFYTMEVVDLRTGDTNRKYNSTYMDVLAIPYDIEDAGVTANIVVNPIMESFTGQGQVQFTLTWGNAESGASSDIDSHLIGPRADGNGNFHVYYSDDYYSEYYEDENFDGDVTYADLDVDDTDYEGPEHTTIYHETPGVYRFYIHNFSDDEPETEKTKKSGIQVTVTIGTSAYTYTCPNENGNLWYVCDYDSVTHTIIPVNKMLQFSGMTSDIGLSEEEIEAKNMQRKLTSIKNTLLCLEENMYVFIDNDAKTQILSQIETFKKRAETTSTLSEADTLYAEVNALNEACNLCIGSLCVFGENIYSHDVRVDGEYDYDDYEYEEYYYYSGTPYATINWSYAKNTYTITSADTELVTLAANDEADSYTVTLKNGLQYTLEVCQNENVKESVQKQSLLDSIENIRYYTRQMDQTDALIPINETIHEVEAAIEAGLTDEVYEDLYDKCVNIEEKLATVSSIMQPGSAYMEGVDIDGMGNYYTPVWDEELEEYTNYEYYMTLYYYENETVDIVQNIEKLNLSFTANYEYNEDTDEYEIKEDKPVQYEIIKRAEQDTYNSGYWGVVKITYTDTESGDVFKRTMYLKGCAYSQDEY